MLSLRKQTFYRLCAESCRKWISLLNAVFPPESPLTAAAQLDNGVEMIKVLRNGGAHLDFRAKDGLTSLHKAARAKNQLILMVRKLPLPAPKI